VKKRSVVWGLSNESILLVTFITVTAKIFHLSISSFRNSTITSSSFRKCLEIPGLLLDRSFLPQGFIKPGVRQT